MSDPIPVVVDNAGQKLPGFIMKITPTGCLIELEKIPFRVGSIVKVEFSIPDLEGQFIEPVRSIKNYDRYFRSVKAEKAFSAGEPEAPTPKKLAEVHFIKLSEQARQGIVKLLMVQRLQAMKRSR